MLTFLCSFTFHIVNLQQDLELHQFFTLIKYFWLNILISCGSPAAFSPLHLKYSGNAPGSKAWVKKRNDRAKVWGFFAHSFETSSCVNYGLLPSPSKRINTHRGNYHSHLQCKIRNALLLYPVYRPIQCLSVWHTRPNNKLKNVSSSCDVTLSLK